MEAGNSLPRNFSYRAVGPPPGPEGILYIVKYGAGWFHKAPNRGQLFAVSGIVDLDVEE
jgi:hypothetical protein